MSFTSFNAQPLRTRMQVAQQVYVVAVNRGLDQFAAVLAMMAIADEVGANGEYWCPANPANFESLNYPHDSTSNDGGSVGYLQQQKGPNGELWWGSTESMITLSSAVDTFLSRLAGNYADARNDPVMAGQFIQAVQQSYDPSGSNYAAKWHEAHEIVAAAVASIPPPPAPAPEETPVTDGKPSYNEFPIWSASNQDRAGTKVDLFLIHTQEGGGGDAAAENLANYLANPANQVSYHYTISQASDGGVTLVDVVDTDLAAWAVGDANDRSINLCFAGSSVNWSREQWLEQSAAIDVAAYIAVQDCVKYGISLDVVPPPYIRTPGISDHMYVTQVLGWGTHTDVGPSFPWDIFAAAVAKYSAPAVPPPVVTPPSVVTPPAPVDPIPAFLDFLATASQLDLLKFIAAQLGPGDPSWVAKGMTLRDKVWGLK